MKLVYRARSLEEVVEHIKKTHLVTNFVSPALPRSNRLSYEMGYEHAVASIVGLLEVTEINKPEDILVS